MLSRFYFVVGLLLISLFVAVTLTGREFGDPERQRIPESVRSAPGGYRSFHSWHSGYRGGK